MKNRFKRDRCQDSALDNAKSEGSAKMTYSIPDFVSHNDINTPTFIPILAVLAVNTTILILAETQFNLFGNPYTSSTGSICNLRIAERRDGVRGAGASRSRTRLRCKRQRRLLGHESRKSEANSFFCRPKHVWKFREVGGDLVFTKRIKKSLVQCVARSALAAGRTART